MNSNREKDNSSKLRGRAMQALRAFIKALEMKDGESKSSGRYRYEIPEGGTTARIYVVATGEDVPGYNRPLEEWANQGKQIRLAFIGLKDAQIVLNGEASAPRGDQSVRYRLNAITGEATLSTNGGDLVADKPTTIEGWARIGREVEKPLFEALTAAQEFQSEDGVRETREKMIARGIIRDPNRRKSAEQDDIQ